jgi:hypothetical protein
MKRLVTVVAAQCAVALALGIGSAFAGGPPIPGPGGPPLPPPNHPSSGVTPGGQHSDGR